MAIPETEPVKNHYGNNSATSFDFDFYIEKPSQLKVQHTDLNGLLTTLKENVDYSIHEIGNENGSYITFPISGSTYDILKWDTVNDKKELLTISLNIPLKQEFEFDISGDLDKHQVEKAFDYQMRVDQILNRKINRAVLVPEGSELTPTELIETLQNSKAEAVQAASDAAMSATNAQNSANLSKEQSDIASDKLNTINQKMEEFSDNYNFATNDIQNKHSDAILDIQNNLQTAEDTIIADRMEAIQAITKNKNNSISDITTAGAEQVTNIKQTGFYMQDGKLYYIDSNGETKEFKSGSAGLEVCDIGTALYIDETKGLRRRLNGQIVDINTNTQAFLDKLVKIKVLTPSLFCTEEEWQAIKTASKLGQCGKFVFNYTGAIITSVRIPAVVNINGLADMANCGMIKAESLPNLKGPAVSSAVSNYHNNTDWKAGANSYGLFEDDNYPDGPLKYVALNGGNVNTVEIHQGTFNASRSSSAYKDNAPVQQEAIQYPYFIQIATGVETEVNIKDTLELNNPFTFGMNMYFKGEMENISWLKSAGQQNPKALCPDFYNWVLANANADKDGFKLSTASDITDYDFEVNTTDETFRLPLKNGLEGMFANGVKGNGMALGMTDGTSTKYTYQAVSGNNLWSRQPGYLTSKQGKVGDTTENAIEYLTDYKFIGIATDASKSGMVVDTTVPTGYNLYYFVGETVKNPNLINAGRIGENLANKLDTPPRYPVEISDKSLMPSWYVVYNDGWCEQGGYVNSGWYSTNQVDITFLKPFKDTNFDVQCTAKGTTYNYYNVAISSYSTTGMSAVLAQGSNGGTYPFSWQVCGYIK